MPLRLAVSLLLYLLGTTLGLSLLPPVLPRVHAVGADDGQWKPVAPAQPPVDHQLAQIVGAHLFAQPNPSDLPARPEPPLTPPDWRISAVYVSTGEAVAVLSMPGKPDQLLHAQDVLPGGAKILAIHVDRLSIQLHGRRLELSTYSE